MELAKLNIDLAEVNAEAVKKATRLNAMAITQSNASNLEALRTEANKEIKAYKAKLDEAEKEYLKPFAEAKARALEAIQPYEEAVKTFGSKLLEAKKAKWTEFLKETYEATCFSYLDKDDGALPKWVPSFEDATAGIALSMSKQMTKDLIQSRVKNSKKEEFVVRLEASPADMAKLKAMAEAMGVVWEEL